MARGQGRVIESFHPRQLHTLAATELALIDLTEERELNSVGLSVSDIAADDWASCQSVGEMIHFLGYQGLRAPSATGAGHRLLHIRDSAPASTTQGSRDKTDYGVRLTSPR